MADVPASTRRPVEKFAALLDDPGVVVNVRVPDEGELPGTDPFVAYDRIPAWDGLPRDRDAAPALNFRVSLQRSRPFPGSRQRMSRRLTTASPAARNSAA